MQIREVFDVVDLHVGGAPVRVIVSGYPELVSRTLWDRQEELARCWDHYRRRLLWEPWGREGLCGCLLLNPERPDSDFGLLFMHGSGYSALRGEAILAVTKLLVETGRVAVPEGANAVSVRYEVPGGRVSAYAEMQSGQVARVRLDRVPAFSGVLGETIRVRDCIVPLDVAFCGGYYAVVPSAALGLAVEPTALDGLMQWAVDIQAVLAESAVTRHPSDDRLSGLAGVIFTDAPHHASHFTRQVMIWADGQVDRSPGVNAVGARLAVLNAQQAIEDKRDYDFEGMLNTVLTGWTTEGAWVQPGRTMHVTVAGQAFVTGWRRFFGNPGDRVSPFMIG